MHFETSVAGIFGAGAQNATLLDWRLSRVLCCVIYAAAPCHTISSCRCCCYCSHGHLFPHAIHYPPFLLGLPLHFYLFFCVFFFFCTFFAVGVPNTRSPFRNLCTHKLKAQGGGPGTGTERKKSVLAGQKKENLAALLELQFR